jgi:hypothetical protein
MARGETHVDPHSLCERDSLIIVTGYSSTRNSEAEGVWTPVFSDVRNDWTTTTARSFLLFFAGTVISVFLAVMAALLVIDPYATGRLTWINHPVSFDTTASKSSVSRIRNPQFNAVVLGNSTLQTLDPHRLNALTSRAFSQVTVPGTGPMEQAAMLRYIARERGSSINTIVLGLDLTWCDPAAMHRTKNPFPFWLYDDSLFRYAFGLFRADNLEALPRRLRVLTGRERPVRLDGFWNYELHVPARPYPYAVPQAVARSAPPYSAAEALRGALAHLPPAVRAVLVLTPVYRPQEAVSDFAEMTGTRHCKAELLAAAQQRANTAFVDRWRDTDLNRRRELFLDAVHFREAVARDIEQGIGQALAALP